MADIQHPLFVFAHSPQLLLALLDSQATERQWRRNTQAVVECGTDVEIDISRLKALSLQFTQLISDVLAERPLTIRLLNASDAVREQAEGLAEYERVKWGMKRLPPVVCKRHFAAFRRKGMHVVRMTSKALQSELEVSQLESELMAVANHKAVVNVVLNMSGVTLLGSSALAVLVKFSTVVKQKDGCALLCGLTEDMANMLRMTQMDRLLPLFADEDEAIQSLG